MLATLALLLAAQVAGGGPASAHDYLISTTPGAGGRVASSPAQVTLTFNEAVNTRFSTVAVTGPKGGAWQSGAPQVLGGTVTQPLRTLGPAGPYRVTWRVVSADGHPVGGAFTFKLTTAGNGTPASAAPVNSTGPAGPTSSTNWVPLAGGLVVVALLLALAAVFLARRRTADEPSRG
jgi:LPXTG-motif cell wall-anchored protein